MTEPGYDRWPVQIGTRCPASPGDIANGAIGCHRLKNFWRSAASESLLISMDDPKKPAWPIGNRGSMLRPPERCARWRLIHLQAGGLDKPFTRPVQMPRPTK